VWTTTGIPRTWKKLLQKLTVLFNENPNTDFVPIID